MNLNLVKQFFTIVGLIGLAGIIVISSIKLSQHTAIAPNAPVSKPLAAETQCVVAFAIAASSSHISTSTPKNSPAPSTTALTASLSPSLQPFSPTPIKLRPTPTSPVQSEQIAQLKTPQAGSMIATFTLMTVAAAVLSAGVVALLL